MRKVLDFLFSMKLALVLMLLFAAAIGTATFIEEKYDTETARMWVYNAKWFEIILLLLVLSFIFNIRRYWLLRKEKFPALLFHLAFILLVAGAGVTRYISFDGTMHIREGQASNIMYSTDPCFQVKASGPGLVFSYDKPLYLGEGKARALRVRVDTKGKGDILITGKRFLKNAMTHTDENGDDVLIVNVEHMGKVQEVQIHTTRQSRPEFSEIILDGITLRMAYGSREIRLPFSLYLEDFVLERYSGSMSPSSYASQVTLIDEPEEVERPFRIYMNHVLDYRGYRFFQSSYDPDEQGTILSVNHDLSGTLISYTGYLLLGIGFFLNLFSRNSRFSSLSRSIRKIRATRKGAVAVFIAMLTLCSGTVFSQKEASVPVTK